DLAAKSRLPSIFALPEYAEAGGLIAYGADSLDLERRSATFVDKILKGAKPADLPVEQPTKFDLIINLRTAKAIGLTIPPSLLLRADQTIERWRSSARQCMLVAAQLCSRADRGLAFARSRLLTATLGRPVG